MKHKFSSEHNGLPQSIGIQKHSFDISSPFNYSKFWAFIEDQFFSKPTEENLTYAAQLIYHYSNLGTFILYLTEIDKLSPKQKKLATVEPLSEFIQSNFHFLIKENNNSNTAACSLDSLQSLLKIKGKRDIGTEIDIISEELKELQKSNMLNMHKYLINIARKENQVILFDKKSEVEMRLDNLTEQIYRLQLRQFADSISRILYNSKLMTYHVEFDPAEELKPVTLNEKEYKELLMQREMVNCTPVNDIFLDKDTHIQANSHKRGRGRSSTFNYQSSAEKSTGTHSNKNIGAYCSVNYPFCHYCRMRRSNVIKCQIKHNVPTTTTNDPNKILTGPKLQIMSLNQAYLIKKDKIYFINNYDGNIRELMENYSIYLKKTEYDCEKYYCESCLKANYNITLDAKTRKTFVCPSCSNICNCTRCFREEQLMKIVGCYMTLRGNLDALYEYLIQKHSIMQTQMDQLMIAKIINLNSGEMKRMTMNQEEVIEKEKEVLECIKYKKTLDDYGLLFKKEFEIARKEKVMIDIMNELGSEINENDNALGKKTKRYGEKKKSNYWTYDDNYETSSSSNENGKKKIRQKKYKCKGICKTKTKKKKKYSY